MKYYLMMQILNIRIFKIKNIFKDIVEKFIFLILGFGRGVGRFSFSLKIGFISIFEGFEAKYFLQNWKICKGFLYFPYKNSDRLGKICIFNFQSIKLIFP